MLLETSSPDDRALAIAAHERAGGGSFRVDFAESRVERLWFSASSLSLRDHDVTGAIVSVYGGLII